MAKHLQLTGVASFIHPLLRTFTPRLNQVVRVSDTEGSTLLAIQVKNDAGSNVAVFTEVSTSVAAVFSTIGYDEGKGVMAGVGWNGSLKRLMIPGKRTIPVPVFDSDLQALFMGDQKLVALETVPFVQMTATGTVKTGMCEFGGFEVVSLVAGATVTIYDGTSTAGRIVVPLTNLSAGQRMEFNFLRLLESGCHVVISGTATLNILVG